VQVAPKSSVADFNRHGVSNSGPLRSIEAFRADPKYSGDGNRIDLAFAVHALAHGASDESIRNALLSRDLSKKGSTKRIADYVARTINKARSALGPVASHSRGR
jgi:hypothetical protein